MIVVLFSLFIAEDIEFPIFYTIKTNECKNGYAFKGDKPFQTFVFPRISESINVSVYDANNKNKYLGSFDSKSGVYGFYTGSKVVNILATSNTDDELEYFIYNNSASCDYNIITTSVDISFPWTFTENETFTCAYFVHQHQAKVDLKFSDANEVQYFPEDNIDLDSNDFSDDVGNYTSFIAVYYEATTPSSTFTMTVIPRNVESYQAIAKINRTARYENSDDFQVFNKRSRRGSPDFQSNMNEAAQKEKLINDLIGN